MNRKKISKEQYNREMKEYRDSNKFMNAYHCHNYKRRIDGFKSISIDEYIEYRKFISTGINNRLRSSRISNFVTWENYKKQNNFLFPEPKQKGNFTNKIKEKITKEFA